MPGPAGSERHPEVRLGQFLLSQASRAGLSARDIAERFQELANQEASRIEEGADSPPDPISEMSFSKSHLDRLYKGSASLPSRRFLNIFLGITSHAAGVHPERRHEILRQAEDLLALERRERRKRRAIIPTASQVPTETVVATLQMQLELERAQRTEDRLRWALSDTQRLMETLLRIINALRDVITESDAKRRLNTAEDTRANDRRIRARSYKATAEAQFTRANERRHLLETLWDQAHENLQRLALHTEATDVAALSVELTLPRTPLPEDVHTQSTLVDIATALGKVKQYNEAEEQAVLELEQAITGHTPLKLDDELNILIAATRLRDDRTRQTALRALLENWPHRRETRDTLIRLTYDENSQIRHAAAASLVENWAGGPAVRDALIALACSDDLGTREIAVLGLAEGWTADLEVRDALIALAHSNDPKIRETVILGLAKGWAADAAVRDALIAFSRDDDVYVRMAVAESLADGWLNDVTAKAALRALSSDTSPSVRWAALQGVPTPAGRHSDSTQETGHSDTLLLAVRLPIGHTLSNSIPLIDTLHRGIAFDAGITVLVGGNGTGKTILMNTLMRLSPRLTTDSPPSRDPSDLSRRLAEEIEAVWNEQRPVEFVHYFTESHFMRHTGQSQISAIEGWLENWSGLMRDKRGPNHLLLLEDPTVFFDLAARKVIYQKLKEFARRGNQVIIASTQNAWIEESTARVVRIGKRALRKQRY
jgi:predicted ATPase